MKTIFIVEAIHRSHVLVDIGYDLETVGQPGAMMGLSGVRIWGCTERDTKACKGRHLSTPFCTMVATRKNMQSAQRAASCRGERYSNDVVFVHDLESGRFRCKLVSHPCAF
jgi:hypothetical protein